MRKSAPVPFFQQSVVPCSEKCLVVVDQRELLLLDDDRLETQFSLSD